MRWLLGLTIFMGGCAGLDGDNYAAFDQQESLNRKSYQLSDAVDRSVVLPAARAYHRIMPDWVERGVLNFFLNLRTVASAANGFLQGKPKSGAIDLSRVAINSTLGLGGVIDWASKWNLPYQEEDFGQTLAVWGYKKSRYVYVPFMGPATVRDLPGLLVRSTLPRIILGRDYHLAISGLDLISVRADLVTATDVRDVSALDPYAFTRDAYYQRRKYLIYDGEPPVDDFFDSFAEDDALEDDAAASDP